MVAMKREDLSRQALPPIGLGYDALLPKQAAGILACGVPFDNHGVGARFRRRILSLALLDTTHRDAIIFGVEPAPFGAA
jgi:hypothetical protein